MQPNHLHVFQWSIAKGLLTMAQTPTSKSALINNAAKDDALGQDGDFTFSITDLLANDPGGAAKVSLLTQFKFGTTAADWADQATYLTNHGITDNGDGTYTIGVGATDIDYMVQIGNKGTWSMAHVDITAPVPPPEPECSAENIVTNSTFEGVTIPNGQDWIIAPITGWSNTGTGSDNGIEAWNQDGLHNRTNGDLAATGNFVIETDAWGDGNPNPGNNISVQDVYQT